MIEWILSSEVIGALCAIHAIATRRRESTGTLAWAAWVFVPFLGPALYLLLGTDRMGRRRRRRVKEIREQHRMHIEKSRERAKKHRAQIPPTIPFAISDQGLFPATFGNTAETLLDTAEILERITVDVQSAARTVYLQFYIIEDTHGTLELKEALIGAMGRGVVVRVIYDAIGTRTDTRFVGDLRAAGAVCLEFIPVKPLKLRFRMGLRNHRKIVVVDGRIGYIGSLNLSERANGHEEMRDIDVRIRGEVVSDLQRIFNEDWRFGLAENQKVFLADTTDLTTFEKDLPIMDDPDVDGAECLQLVPSGPDDPAVGMMRMLVTAIHQAETSVDLATPYFIPPQALLGAIQSAAARGVRVRILVPKKSDAWVVDIAMRLWVGLVLERDVEVRTHRADFHHEKFSVIDGRIAFIGSSNLDQRSAFLNFEADLVAYAGSLPPRLTQYFSKRWKDSDPYKIPIWLLPRSVRSSLSESRAWVETGDKTPRWMWPFKRFLYRLVWLTSPLL